MRQAVDQRNLAQSTGSGSAGRDVGIGLRAPHYQAFLSDRPQLDFVEVHSENFFGREQTLIGGRPWQILEQARTNYAVSLHGVGLSLGSAEPVDAYHLQQLAQLVERVEPRWVSEHLSWTGIGGVFANDLLPLPYTEEALALVAANIQRVQETLRRPLLIENPSRYLAFTHSTMDETEFLAALAKITGCSLLLDINNVYVSAINLGSDPDAYLQAIDPVHVAEIHLAGFTEQDGLLLDTHSQPVAPPVWDLYAKFLDRAGARPTLIEWDTELPALPVLLAEAEKAEKTRTNSLSEVSHARAG